MQKKKYSTDLLDVYLSQYINSLLDINYTSLDYNKIILLQKQEAITFLKPEENKDKKV